jgi:hypothetical protein
MDRRIHINCNVKNASYKYLLLHLYAFCSKQFTTNSKNVAQKGIIY